MQEPISSKSPQKIEKDIYDSLIERYKEVNPKTPEEIQQFYKDFSKEYRNNNKEIETILKKEMYSNKLKKDKRKGFHKSMTFHTSWDKLMNGK